MSRNSTRWIAAVVVLLAAVLTIAATRDEQLADGDILVDTIPVDGAEYPKVRVEGLVDAPPARVWSLLADCEASARMNSRVKTSRVVRRVGDDVVCLEEVAMPFPLRNLTTISRWSFDPGPPRWRRSWSLVDGDFDYADGSWTLTKTDDGRTHAVYENHFKPQIAVPDWLAKAFLKVGMPGMMKDLRNAAAK